MQPITKKVAMLYGAWICLWLAIALYGKYFTSHGEFGISAHLWLILTGFPFSLLSLAAPNGTVLGAFVAGLLGLLQWCQAAEAVSRWIARRKAENVKS